MYTTEHYIGLAISLVAFAYVLSSRGERKPIQPTYNVPQDGMVASFICIVRQITSDNVNTLHLAGIMTMIIDFRLRFAYNAEMQDYYKILLDQYRELSDRLQPEGEAPAMIVDGSGHLEYKIA